MVGNGLGMHCFFILTINTAPGVGGKMDGTKGPMNDPRKNPCLEVSCSRPLHSTTQQKNVSEVPSLC